VDNDKRNKQLLESSTILYSSLERKLPISLPENNNLLLQGRCFMDKRLTGNNGFTLIELMIVVVIIGILAALAIPRFSGAATRSKQGEAAIILKQIATYQMTYRVDSPTNSYFISGATASAAAPLAFSALGLEIPPSARYSYTITANGAEYIATATCDLDGDGYNDIWTINPSGKITCTNNDVTNIP